MATKRIHNTSNHHYYSVRQTTSKSGRKGQVLGRWTYKKN